MIKVAFYNIPSEYKGASSFLNNYNTLFHESISQTFSFKFSLMYKKKIMYVWYYDFIYFPPPFLVEMRVNGALRSSFVLIFSIYL